MKRLIYSFALLVLAILPASAQISEELRKELDVKIESDDIITTDGEKVSPQAYESRHRKSASLVYGQINFLRQMTISYNSIDAKKKRVRLSAKIYLPWGSWDTSLGNAEGWIPIVTIRHILLNCHPTVTSNFEAPTGAIPVDNDIKRMVTENTYSWMVVCPDYCGYGQSTHLQHPYLIHDVTARNCIDAELAAISLYDSGDIRNVDPWWAISYTWSPFGYSTDIVGYSQGGATALACTKYLESDTCPQDVKNTIKLRQTTCGDGPYSIIATLDQYLAWGRDKKELEYPCVLPLIVAAAKEAHNDGCMRSVEVEKYFTEQFLKTKILDYLNSKTTTTVDLNALIKKAMGTTPLLPVNVLSDKVLKADGTYNTTTNEYKCLMRAFEQADLTRGWTPKHPITFYHLECDGVVPYANYNAVKDGIQKGNSLVKFVSAQEAHSTFLDFYSLENIEQGTWSPLTFFEFDWVAGSLASGILNPDYEHTNHADGGTLFYVDYMFGHKLRNE